MNENLAARQRRRELLITMAFTVFSVLMIIVSSIEHWPIFYIPLIAAEIALIWWSYVRGFQTYLFRALLVTTMTCLNVFLYGIYGETFFFLLPTLCVQFVLLSLFELTQIIHIAIVETIALFLYHVFIKKTFVIPDSSFERNRMILQLLSFVILILLCLYRIYHHIQEESDVVELEEQVKRVQKIKDDFVANTSHELRTPVNTVSGMCEILLQKSLPDDIHRSVLDIQMTGVELQNIVTDILDFASLEAGTLDLAPRAYNITSTLNDVMNMTVFENREKQLEIIFDCDPNIPCLLEGDEQQLRRILNNLINNAIKFTQEGGVTVRVTYRKEEYGINLILSVKDTGVGLGQEEQERILRGFYQTDSDRNRRSSGMGLGLTICSALIKKMGGFLTIKSQPGQGSQFSFAIPQKVVNEQPCISLRHPGTIRLIWFYNPQSPVPSMRDSFVEHIRHFSDYFGIVSYQATSLEECKRRISQGKGNHLIIGKCEYLQDQAYFDELSNTHPIILIADRTDVLTTAPRIHVLYKPYNAIMLAGILNGTEQVVTSRKKEQRRFVAPTAKILVVDDNLMNLKVVEGLLRKYRIKIVAASSGEEALTLIESKDYDFVFMDHMMPGMDGVECFHLIRNKQDPYFAQVPIIALTANAIAGSREMFLEEGFNEFIAKPIDTALLNEILRRFIPLEKQIYEEETMEETKPEAPKKVEPKVSTVSVNPFPIPEVRTEMPVADAGDLFADLEGIDEETALMYCGSAEDFLELVDTYCESGSRYANDLQAAYATRDMKEYALLSHTIKSTSKTLGALHLSDLAYAQEMAAKEEKEDVISENHKEFHTEYLRVLSMLGNLRNKDAEEDAEAAESVATGELSQSDWESLKAELRACLESYETGSFEERLQRSEGQTLNGKPVTEVLSEVLKKASNFDFDGAIAVLDEIGGPA